MVLTALAAATTVAAATTSDVTNSLEGALVGKGYADTAVCLRTRSIYGAKHYWTIQYKPASRFEIADALAMLTDITPAVPGFLRFIAFAPKRSWQQCNEAGKTFVFWKDEVADWRLVEGGGVAFFEQYLEQLAPDKRGTVDEAYVVFYRAGAEAMANRRSDAINSYLRVVELSENAGEAGVDLVRLALFHLSQAYREEKDETNATKYLQRYALAAENRVESVNYMPLIKVDPVYPPDALERRIGGRVVVEFTVETDGTTSEPVVVEEDPEGEGFGASAIAATRQFRYVPAVEDGKLVRVKGVRNRVNFSAD
jgi:TonB family protein